MLLKRGFNPKDLFEAVYQALELFPEGVRLVFEAPEKEKRTNPQNNYYWLICESVSSCLNDAGVDYKKIKHGDGVFSISWNQEKIHEVNKEVFGVKTTKDLSRKEFCEYMEKVFSLWLEKTQGNWEVPIPITKYFDDYL